MSDAGTTPPAGPAGDGTTNTDTSGTQGGDKSFTQADVDQIVQERLARAKSAPPADYDDLKAKAAKFDELDAANKSEHEKLVARAEAAEKAALQATERARATALRAAIVTAASAAGAVDADAVVALLPGDAVTVGDDGQVTGAAEAVAALLESKPYLVGTKQTAPAGSADGGPRGNGTSPKQLTREALHGMTPEQIDEARRSGALNELMGIK